ncbi:MAG: Uncharacterised protein [Flavobacteriia bacterium]|nr:MAG: Uncharacterised protein [Flavobacteriia bacterium]
MIGKDVVLELGLKPEGVRVDHALQVLLPDRVFEAEMDPVHDAKRGGIGLQTILELCILRIDPHPLQGLLHRHFMDEVKIIQIVGPKLPVAGVVPIHSLHIHGLAQRQEGEGLLPSDSMPLVNQSRTNGRRWTSFKSRPLLSTKAQIPFIAQLVFQLYPAQTPQGVEIQEQLFHPFTP